MLTMCVSADMEAPFIAALAAAAAAVSRIHWQFTLGISVEALPVHLSPSLLLDCFVLRLYVCYVDRLGHHLLLSVDWVVVARLVEDAAIGR